MDKNYLPIWIATVCIVVGLLFSCESGIVSNRQIQLAMHHAGANREELKKVLRHFRNDSQKLQAARYLIANMIYHSGSDDHLVSLEGERYELDLKPFTTKKWSARKYCDSLFGEGYTIAYDRLPDITLLDSKYLIDNIDLAFEVWRKPWAKQISFEDFCRYILPYRSAREKACSLRREFMERYLPVLEATGATTPLDACVAVNNQLCKEIRYFATGSPLYSTLETIQNSGVGDCEGLAAYTAFAMRAVGIPIAVDNTIWPKMANGHVWCSVLNNDGKFHDFTPGDPFDPTTRLAWYHEKKLRIPAKVYRSMFDPQKQPETSSDDDGYQTFLKDPMVYDVTILYPFPLIDIRLTVDIPVENGNGIVYLCAFNRHKWIPLALGQRKGNQCIFKEVVGDNIFIVTDSPDGKVLRNITVPFYTDTLGNIRKFIPDPFCFDSLVLPKMLPPDHKLSYWNQNKQCFEEINRYDAASDSTEIYRSLLHNTLLLYAFPPHGWHDARVCFVDKGVPCIY